MFSQIVSIAGEELRYQYVQIRQKLTQNHHVPAKVLVNGSPKSGTTWMVKLISSLPGYREVGNYQGDFQKYYQSEPGDVIHGHDPFSLELKQILAEAGIKVVLMVRDPRDQLVSRMFHIKRSSKHVWHDRMRNIDVDEALMMCIEGRENLPATSQVIALAQTWMVPEAEMLCIRYEDMLADPVTHFSKVMQYIGMKEDNLLARVVVERNRFERLSVGKRIWQQQRRPGQEDANSHFRKGIAGDWRNYLKPEHVARFKELAGRQLIELGYEQDMDW
ncbi:MAG: hypothetical protein Kow0080_02280 [Candidatus Promineifilaceae bacterium]